MPLVWKLLALVAVLLMPFGMAGAAASPRHHQAMAGMNHCPEQGQHQGKSSGLADCAMACAAALPAVDLQDSLAPLAQAGVERPALAARLHGLHPETAKPPPRLS